MKISLVTQLVVLSFSMESEQAEMQVLASFQVDGQPVDQIVTFKAGEQRVLSGLNNIIAAFADGALVYNHETSHLGVLPPWTHPRLSAAKLHNN